LKEDYEPEKLFVSGILMYFGVVVGGFLGARVSIFGFSNFWFWGGIVGFFLVFLLLVIRERLRFFEVLEAAFVGLLFLYMIIFLADFLGQRNFLSLGGTLFLIGLMLIFWFLDGHYKSFSWYKSGRVGFSGLTVLGLMFLVRTAVVILGVSMLSFSGKIDAVFPAHLHF
jgi:hypothetical protein